MMGLEVGDKWRRRAASRSGSSDSALGVPNTPPHLKPEATAALRDEAVSWAAQHGLLIGTESSDAGAHMAASFTHAPVAVLPTPFPRDVFELAVKVSPLFASLSDAVSRDDAFLRETLAGVILTDDFTERIWRIYEACGAQEGRHPMELGILRSDYMLDVPSGLPLQVEVNTVSTSFMSLSTRVGEMHRHLIPWSGIQREYGVATETATAASIEEDRGSEGGGVAAGERLLDTLPLNAALDTAAATLAAGWRAMGNTDAKVLMVVQPNERNIFDQRLIAAKLWEKHGVRVVRATLKEIHDGAEIISSDENDDDDEYGGKNKTLLRYGGDVFSVVYFRAGYAPTDYPTEAEWSARELLERSGAVKSPSAAMHLAGTKKVQQVLAEPGVLERFVKNPQDAQAMRKVFAGLYALDGERAADAVALGLADPGSYVLKPQREGGGNNLYGDELVAALKTFDAKAAPGEPGDLSAYILMQRIFPPVNTTLCLRTGEMVELETLSELGIYGGYLRVGEEIVMNTSAGGHLLRTKAATSDEGGVAAGYAVLDSPFLY